MKTIPLLYIGRRFINDRLMDCFLIEGKTKKEANFSARSRFCSIGEWYKGTQKGKEEDLFISTKTPDRIEGKKVSDEQIEKWNREDDAAVISQRRKTAAAKAKRHLKTYMSSSYNTLAGACKNLSYFEVHDFVSYLVNEIQKGKKK